jgi:penicillin amidase
MISSKFVLTAVLGTSIIILSLSCTRMAEKALPDYNEHVSLKGLRAPVTVIRDSLGIPHVFAANHSDLYRAVGFCMAQDRLWQMDLMQRATHGCLSEIFGKDLIETDMIMRCLRIPAKARVVIDSMGRTEEGRVFLGYVDAFCSGVNDYIARAGDRLPPEFKILKYKPAPWQSENIFCLIGYMAWDLTCPWYAEIALDRIRGKFGESMMRQLLPDSSSPNIPVFGPQASLLFSDASNRLATANGRLRRLGISGFAASNTWAVGPSRTASHKPLLANDMHLELFAPGIWYPIHQIIKDSLDVTGLVLPGQPFVVSGHNGRIAWGLTDVMLDNMDFYLEKINPADSGQYEFNGAWRKLEILTMDIPIKGGTVVKKTLRCTHRGPIISSLKAASNAAISFRWTGNWYSNEGLGVCRLNHAKNWQDFRAAVREFTSINQNISYADIDGNIGLQCAAGIPIRPSGDGVGIFPGWTGSCDWKGMVPFEQLPYEFNPVAGFVSAANNKTVDKFPYYLSVYFCPADRNERIRAMIRERSAITGEDFKRMHYDVYSTLASRVTPQLVKAVSQMPSLSALEKAALDSLKSWDFRMTASSRAACIFSVFHQQFLDDCLQPKLGDSLYKELRGSLISMFTVFDRLWFGHAPDWVDDPKTKTRENVDDIAVRSFRAAVASLRKRCGDNVDSWTWGRLHTLTLKHPMGSVAILDFLFRLNRGPWPCNGSYHTVNATNYPFTSPFECTQGPSERTVFDLADWDKSWSVIPTGVSGNPASPHYCDQTTDYLAGRYHPDVVSRPLVEKRARYRMEMTAE